MTQKEQLWELIQKYPGRKARYYSSKMPINRQAVSNLLQALRKEGLVKMGKKQRWLPTKTTKQVEAPIEVTTTESHLEEALFKAIQNIVDYKVNIEKEKLLKEANADYTRQLERNSLLEKKIAQLESAPRKFTFFK